MQNTESNGAYYLMGTPDTYTKCNDICSYFYQNSQEQPQYVKILQTDTFKIIPKGNLRQEEQKEDQKTTRNELETTLVGKFSKKINLIIFSLQSYQDYVQNKLITTLHVRDLFHHATASERVVDDNFHYKTVVQRSLSVPPNSTVFVTVDRTKNIAYTQQSKSNGFKCEINVMSDDNDSKDVLYSHGNLHLIGAVIKQESLTPSKRVKTNHEGTYTLYFRRKCNDLSNWRVYEYGQTLMFHNRSGTRWYTKSKNLRNIVLLVYSSCPVQEGYHYTEEGKHLTYPSLSKTQQTDGTLMHIILEEVRRLTQTFTV